MSGSIFAGVEQGPAIEVFALNRAFLEDTNPKKANLGVGESNESMMSTEHDVETAEQQPFDDQQCEINDVVAVAAVTVPERSLPSSSEDSVASAPSSAATAAVAAIDLKRYSRHALMSLRKDHRSLQHPECALKSELQVLSIWTCRLRNELQYLGLWKAPNTGNQYGNCTGGPGCCSNDGGCDGIGDDSTYELGGGNDGPGGGGGFVGGLHQQPHMVGPSSLLANKRTVRPRFMNPQRGINSSTSSIGGGGGIGGGYIDHRSISSSHLMPAFVKRRSGNIPGKPSEGGPSNLRSGSASSGGYGGTNDNDSSDGNEDHKTIDPSVLHGMGGNAKRKELAKPMHIFKSSPNNRPNKDDLYAEAQSGWIPPLSKLNPEYSPSGNKPMGGGNKRLVYERRIGSGRLMPREDSWGDMRPGEGKRGEKDKVATSQSKYNDNGGIGGVDKLNLRNASARFSDSRNPERPHYERHVLVEGAESDITSRDKYDSSAAAGQRTMSFRSRGFMGNSRDHRGDFKDYRDTRGGAPRERRESREYNRYSKDEPEWLSEGPTSQHDTIELRGFEEMDMAESAAANGDKDSQIRNERKDSESSLFNSSSNMNLNISTKEKPDGSHDTLNSDNNIKYDIRDTDADDHDINCSDNKDVAKEAAALDNTMEKQAEQVVAASVAVAAAADAAVAVATAVVPNDAVNITEQFFERFLNIDTLEGTLIGGHQQSLPYNESGSSRFSRWFSNNTENNNNNDMQTEMSPPIREEKRPLPLPLPLPPPPNTDLNENQNDVNSLMAFFKSSNVPTPDLPKGFPSAPTLSVGELEARMRKMDSSGDGGDGGFMMHGCNDGHMRNSDNVPQTNEMSGQDIGAFRKLLDQLNKPKVDMSMNLIMPPGEQHMQIPTPIGMLPPGMIPHGLPHPTPPPLNMLDHEDMLKLMHQQHMMRRHQTMLKMIPPQHHRMPPQQPSPQYQVTGASKNMPLGASHHPHLMSPIMGNHLQEQPPQPNPGDMMHVMQQPRPVHSPTPLAFTPTSVLRKMTAEKDNNSHQTSMPLASPQQQQQQQQQQQLSGPPIQTPPPLQQHMIKLSQQQQQQQQQHQLQQHINPPRMILGAGNLQHLQQQQPPPQMPPNPEGSPQMLPPHLRNQPLAGLKWPPGFIGGPAHPSMVNVNSMNKPMGRPILKGPVSQVMQHPQNPLKQIPNHMNDSQNAQNPQQVGQMQQFPQQPPPMLGGHPFPAHFLQNQSPQNNHQHHLFQQQRSLEMQRQQMFQQHPFLDMAVAAAVAPPHHQPPSANNDNNSATNLNYQADGRLSPTSNVLAQWFSPEVLAKASAGKLPLLNMNQALSLEALEKSIQHSSTPVHN